MYYPSVFYSKQKSLPGSVTLLSFTLRPKRIKSQRLEEGVGVKSNIFFFVYSFPSEIASPSVPHVTKMWVLNLFLDNFIAFFKKMILRLTRPFPPIFPM